MVVVKYEWLARYYLAFVPIPRDLHLSPPKKKREKERKKTFVSAQGNSISFSRKCVKRLLALVPD